LGFATFSAVEKALAGRKKRPHEPHVGRGPYVVQAWLTGFPRFAVGDNLGVCQCLLKKEHVRLYGYNS